MLRHIAVRILQFPLILAIIYLLTFTLAWIVPGSPFSTVAEKRPNPIAEEQLKKTFHAETLHEFLAYYPKRVLLSGDFGPSMYYQGWSVNDILKSALPVSVSLGLMALVLATLVGTGIGTLAAVRKGGFFDWASLGVALIGISLPGFVAAGLLLALFCDKLHWFPSVGWGSPKEMVLPAIALSLMPLAYIARLTRVAMLDVLGQDYVRTARAKGLGRSTVIWRHCFRNAFLPVFTFLGPAAAATLTGSFVVEKIFDIPGLGQHFVNSVLNRDQTMILGTVMVYSTFLLVLNFLVDIGYSLIDPRIDVTASAKAG